MTIKIIITGGTIDAKYNELSGKLIYEQTHLSKILRQARCTLNVNTEITMLKNSLDINVSDRKKILQICKKCKEDKIIITHGTDTMVKTAETIGKNVKNKTIVMLGAMVPYSFANSDALFNLGCATSAVQSLKKGVYITMNGKIFSWDNVKKDRTVGQFKTLK